MILGNHNVHEYSVEQTKRLAYRVIDEAIRIGAFGMGHPITMWFLPHDQNRQIEEVGSTEIEAIGEKVGLWRQFEQKLFKDEQFIKEKEQ